MGVRAIPIRAVTVAAMLLCALTWPSGRIWATDADELLRLGDWLHGPPGPDEPLWAHA